jgi:hypothetical protein
MNISTSNSVPSSAFFVHRKILGLNRIGNQQFQRGHFPEASDCFLSAIQSLKRACSFGGEPPELSNDDYLTFDQSQAWCQEFTIEKRTMTTRLSALMRPMTFRDAYFSLHHPNESSSVQWRDVYSRDTLVGLILIFNLASTIHHYALVIDEQQKANSRSNNSCFGRLKPTVSREVLVNHALQLYECALEGVSSTYDCILAYPGLDKTLHARQLVLRQQLLLSSTHNMGLLLGNIEEERSARLDVETRMNPNNSNSNFATTSRDVLPTSYRCFQVVFASLHSLSDYYGIQHSDFPSDFELQVVVDTALERLQICHPLSGSGQNPSMAPCA